MRSRCSGIEPRDWIAVSTESVRGERSYVRAYDIVVVPVHCALILVSALATQCCFFLQDYDCLLRRFGTRVQPCAMPSLLFDKTIFFFFQAEDGIRDLIVTGVQTCALPI